MKFQEFGNFIYPAKYVIPKSLARLAIGWVSVYKLATYKYYQVMQDFSHQVWYSWKDQIGGSWKSQLSKNIFDHWVLITSKHVPSATQPTQKNLMQDERKNQL